MTTCLFCGAELFDFDGVLVARFGDAVCPDNDPLLIGGRYAEAFKHGAPHIPKEATK